MKNALIFFILLGFVLVANGQIEGLWEVEEVVYCTWYVQHPVSYINFGR